MKMTEKQKKQIDACRENGLTISATAAATGLPIGTVKSYCRRKDQELEAESRCKFCGCYNYIYPSFFWKLSLARPF